MSLIAILYIGYVALVQEDMKKLIAYSSIAHMGFVTLGLFIALRWCARTQSDRRAPRHPGAMVQMISHGFVSGAMFACVGVMYDRMHTRMIKDYGGVANTMPWFAAFWCCSRWPTADCRAPAASSASSWSSWRAFQDDPWLPRWRRSR
jgi:NADH-quinone oxidoreductase subunit M